jgi:hypothetical protein
LITAEFNYGSERVLKSFVFSGHDDSAAGGKNIICAAASVLALNFSQSVIKLLKIKLSGVIKEGLINLSLPDGICGESAGGLHLLTESVKLGFMSINEKYGEVIKIIETIKD